MLLNHQDSVFAASGFVFQQAASIRLLPIAGQADEITAIQD